MPFIYTDILYNIFSAPVHCIIEHYLKKKIFNYKFNSFFIILYQNQRSKKKRPIGFWLHSDK